jgi:hypothetical protein
MSFDVISEYEKIAGRSLFYRTSQNIAAVDWLRALEIRIREDERGAVFARGDDPKHWLPCNRPLSPAELRYRDQIRKDEGVGVLRKGVPSRVLRKRISRYLQSGRERHAVVRAEGSWLDAIG